MASRQRKGSFITRYNELVEYCANKKSRADFNKFRRLCETIKVALTVSFDLISDVLVVLVLVHAGLAE